MICRLCGQRMNWPGVKAAIGKVHQAGQVRWLFGRVHPACQRAGLLERMRLRRNRGSGDYYDASSTYTSRLATERLDGELMAIIDEGL